MVAFAPSKKGIRPFYGMVVNGYTTQQFLKSRERNKTVTTGKALDGKPHAVSPRVAPSQCYGVTGRFDEGDGVPTATPRHGSRLGSRILLVLSVTAALFAEAATVELTVDSDTTLSAALTSAGETLNDGDTLVKKGLGKLTSDQVFADGFKLSVTVSEGVLEITAPGQLGFTNQIIVEDGATLLLSSTANNVVLLTSRTIKLSGNGALGYKGALVLAGTASWQVLTSITFNLPSDAVIAATTKGQWGLFSSTTLNMNNHILTLVGDVASGTPEFRFRYKATINNAAGFVLKNISLTSTPKSTAEHVCNPKVPYLMMDATSTFTSGTADGMFLGCFATYIAEYGATITIPNWGLGVTGVGGSPTVGTGASAVLQVNGTYTAHADDLLAGNCFNSSAAGLKFGNTSSSSVVFEVDDWSKLVGGSTAVYTAASAATGKGIAYAGTLSITNENPYAAHWSLDKTSDTDKLLLKWSANKPEGVVSVTDWGIEPGEANQAGNAAKFNAGVANLAEGSTLWFPVGDWYFDAPVTMPDEDKVAIELEAGLAKLHYSDGGVSVTMDPAADPTNVIIRVEYGATATVDEAIAAASFDTWPTGASLEKRGGGTLVASDTIRDLVGSFHIYEGVMQAAKNGDLGQDNDAANRIYVHSGATLLLAPETDSTIILNKRTLQLEGSGYGGLAVPGALAFDTKWSWQVLYDCSIALEDDTVISSRGTASQHGLFTYATLNMKSHTLTLTCDTDKQANYRFRFGRSIQNAGTIILDRAKLSTTNDGIEISPADTLKVVLKRGGTLSPYRASFYDGISSIECTAASTGISGRINADSADIAVTLKDVSGPLTIDSKVTATITGTLGVKASDIADDKALTSANALTFAAGSVFAFDRDVELPPTVEGDPATYTIATSTVGVSGHPLASGITLGECRYRLAVADDGKSLKLVRAGGLRVILR